MSARNRSHARAWRTAGVVLLLYAAAAGLACTASGSLMFQPRYGSFRAPLGGERIPLTDGRELSALYLPNPAARFTLWYFHGNAEDLGNIEPRLHALHDLGYAVFAFDYPGYGLSNGAPSEQSIYEATRAALAHLRQTRGVRPEQIVVYGRSLGGGPAVELAVHEPVAGLILESAFMSAYRVMTHWRLLPFDQFENLRKISRVTCPVLVIHGRDDRVVPFYHGEALFAKVKSTKQHLWVDFAGHNDLAEVAGQDYWRAVKDFGATLPVSPLPAQP